MTPNAVRAAVAAPTVTPSPWGRIKRVLPFIRPVVASVAYVDPGNFATNI